ncbi:DUF6221 family protein [Streptomyces anulatus]|uniref:DUF6221 family protein n=1 Tax=Streptomyces anulatus TaxID=1892 RepID=UPI003426A6EE
MTDALAAFLRARFAEDHEAARLTFGVNGMARIRRGEPAPRWVPSPEGDAGIWDTDGTPRVKHVWARERNHIIRQDPARTLREVEAAQAVLGLYEEAGDCMDRAMSDGDTGAYQEARIEQRTLRKVLLHEATVHEAHPDYLPEWRP